MRTKDPYWLIRSKCFLLNIPIYGEKTKLQQEYESFLFLSISNHNDNLIPKTYDCIVKANIDLFENKFGKINGDKQFISSFEEQRT